MTNRIYDLMLKLYMTFSVCSETDIVYKK